MAKKEPVEASVPTSSPVLLLPADLALIFRLLPRAQIQVGDMPHVYPLMARLEAAVQTGKVFHPVVDGPPAQA